MKPRLSISSCRLQLGHPRGLSWVVLVAFSAEERGREAACDGGSRGAQERTLGSGVRPPVPGLCLPADQGPLESYLLL